MLLILLINISLDILQCAGMQYDRCVVLKQLNNYVGGIFAMRSCVPEASA